MTLSIRKGQKIAGYDVHLLRHLFRKVQCSSRREFDCFFVAHTLRLPHPQAQRMITKLAKRKYLTSTKWRGETFYRLTADGLCVANASAGPRISRSRAEAMLQAFISRIKAVNSDARYAYRIASAVIFGSYLSTTESLGDVDVAIELVQRGALGHHRQLQKSRRDVARQTGRRFATFLDELFWPQWEVQLLLKNRQRGLNLHEINELAEMSKRNPLSYKVIYGDKRRIARMLAASRRKSS